jgi:tetratricopeptide (TPR) repeat protein
MKGRLFAIGLLLLAFAACTSRTKVAEHGRGIERLSPSLSAIDSLMWHQPDSAFTTLLQFAASPKADSLNAFNGHYCQLLISELLFKKYYKQTNREDLLLAVDYFDSLCGRDVSRNVSTNAFLDARAHYINGVGYYEHDSIAEACAEYLKALEVMESHYEDKELTGKKAMFMTYTYNRLMELFSLQFMMDPAIACGEKVLTYCQREPSLSQEIPTILFHIGKQYDKKGDKNKARSCYEQALEGMSDSHSLVFRDIVCIKALCDYQIGGEMEQPLAVLRQILGKAQDEKERMARLLTIGDIFFEGGIYDSALLYLEPVYENTENSFLQIQAAELLYVIYDSLGESEKNDDCMRFIAQQKKSEGENKALVSQLEGLFQEHKNWEQESKTAEEKQEAVFRTIKIIIPIAVIVGVFIMIMTKRQNKKRMADQHKKHRMEQAAISSRLKRSNEELRELKDQIRQQTDNMSPKSEAQALSFSDEPICRLIMDRVNEGQFKAQIDCIIYKDYALDKDQLSALRKAVDRHFNLFTIRISKAYPELTRLDLDYCCLYLLGLSDADLSALMQRAYNTVNERNSKLRRIFGSENAITITLQAIANESVSI